MLKNQWFCRIQTARAGGNFENSCRFFSRTYGAIRVILWYAVLKFLKNPLVFEGFGVRAQKKKRMCPAWYYLTGMMALAGAQPLLQKFEAREKVARKSPFWQKCWKSGVFPRNPQERAGWNFDHFLFKNHWVFYGFMLKSLRKLRFWEDFVLRARMCTWCHFLQWILEVWVF